MELISGMNEICYFCGLPANTIEHVPPKCIFPERKDSNGIDYRKNLITVPACSLHNCAKSQDDEFFMVSLAGILGNNSIGYNHYNHGKVQRTLIRSSYRLLDNIFTNKIVVNLPEGKNKFIKALVGNPDIGRLNKCVECIAMGLYYHDYREIFKGKLRCFYDFLYTTDKNHETLKKFIKAKIPKEINSDKKGDNPQIFYYQWGDIDNIGLFCLKLCFYDNAIIYITFIRENINIENNFVYQIMKICDKVILNVDDKEFKFSGNFFK